MIEFFAQGEDGGGGGDITYITITTIMTSPTTDPSLTTKSYRNRLR